MEFTSSFKMKLAKKLILPTTNWDGKIDNLSELAGGDIHHHIEYEIGTTWNFGDENTILMDRYKSYKNISVLLFPHVLERNSKTVIAYDSDNDRFFISFSSDGKLSKADVLAHFNLTIGDELDNYKHTSAILSDTQRASLLSKPSVDTAIEAFVGRQYGDTAAKLAILVSEWIANHHGESINVLDIGSGDATTAEYNGSEYEINYEYIYIDERLDIIRLICHDTDLYTSTIDIPVDDEMRTLYHDVMYTTYLLNILRNTVSLTDEAMTHDENWQDAI